MKRHNHITDEELATWFEESSPEDYETAVDGTAEVLLFRAARMKKLAEEEAIKAVRVAQREGLSWQQIGSALGLSRQGAFQHYKPLVDA